MSALRKWADKLRRTPLHPQWLLGRRQVPRGLESVEGVLVDIGAADRWIAPHVAKTARYIALDYPPTGHVFYAARPDVFAEATRLPFADGSIDAVVCLEVIEHVHDAAAAIREIARVLKPGGRAWISMPFLYPLHNEPYDFQRYTEFGLRRDFALAKLDVVRIDRSGHAIRAAGVLMCLAIAGGANAVRSPVRFVLLPAAAAGVLLVNLACRALSAVWPDWAHMASGHNVELRKPDAALARQ